MHKLAVLLFPLLFLAGCNAFAFVGEPRYISLGILQNNNVWVYNYTSFLTHGVDSEAQNVTFSAKLEVTCESYGEYAYKKAKKYCLYVTEGRLEHTRNQVINFDKEQLGGRFCFVQTEDGQTPVVFHTKSTSQWVINLQKALVTGFQANFAGKAEVAETDHESEHISHYRYINPTEHTPPRHMVRYFHEKDIAIFAGGHSLPLSYSKEEEILYNEEGVLNTTRGQTNITIIPKREDTARANMQQSNSDVQEPILNRGKPPEKGHRWRRAAGHQQYQPSPQSFFPSVNLNHFSIHSHYTIQLIERSAAPSRRRRDVGEREIESSLKASSTYHAEEDGGIQTHKLNVTAVLEHIHQSPEDTQQVEVEALKKYLSTEENLHLAQAINQAIDYLNNVCELTTPDDVAMKLKLYQILASLPNSDAQQALLSCLEKVTDTNEWSSLVVNIGLAVTPTSGFVARLESLLRSGTEMDSNSLVLMYGAVASRADARLQSHMVAYLTARVQKHTEDTDYTVVLIHALGNTGSYQMTDILLSLLDDDRVDVEVAAINALRKQTSNTRVKRVFLKMLRSRNQTASIVSAIANTLVKSIEASGVTDVQTSRAYARALVYSSRALDNSYISGLVTFYLHALEKHDPSVGTRLRREAGHWGVAGEEYKMIASYKDREEDGVKYPKNSAQLWSRQLGVEGFNLQVAAGMFTGASESGKERKIFGRAATRVNAFGYTLDPVEVEALRIHDGSGVKKRILVGVGGNVLLSSNATTDGTQLLTSFWGPNILQLEESMVLFVGVAKIDIRLNVRVHLNSSFNVNRVDTNNTNTFLTAASLSPSVKVSMRAFSQFNVMGTEGNVTLEGEVGYAFEAKGSVTGCVSGPPAFSVSTSIKEQWPSSYVKLSSGFKPLMTVPCGFEKCVQDEARVQDSVPVERWVMDPDSSGEVWDDTVSTGEVGDWGQCPTAARVTESELQFWWEESNMGQGARHPTR